MCLRAAQQESIQWWPCATNRFTRLSHCHNSPLQFANKTSLRLTYGIRITEVAVTVDCHPGKLLQRTVTDALGIGEFGVNIRAVELWTGGSTLKSQFSPVPVSRREISPIIPGLPDLAEDPDRNTSTLLRL
jgi:hypothetical protein